MNESEISHDREEEPGLPFVLGGEIKTRCSEEAVTMRIEKVLSVKNKTDREVPEVKYSQIVRCPRV